MSTPSKPTDGTPILVLHSQPELYRDILEERFPDQRFVECHRADDLSQALDTHRPEVVLGFTIARPFPRQILVEAPSVRWVHAGGTGVDHLVPWDPDKMTVTNSPLHKDIMSQYVICGVLMLSLGLPRFIAQQRQHLWRAHPLPSVAGKTLAVVGFGRIGELAGAHAQALGMRVLGVRTAAGLSPHAEEVRGIDRLAETLSEADFVALALPLTSQTRGLIDAPAIAAFKPGALLVNMSRGGVVDEAALIQALASGAVAAACIDVFATEPLPQDSPFWDLDNVIVTPHTGDPPEWQRQVASLFCDNLDRWLGGKPLVGRVEPDKGY